MSVRRGRRFITRPTHRAAAGLSLGAVAVLAITVAVLWATPSPPPPRGGLPLLLWASPQRGLFLAIRLSLGMAAGMTVAAMLIRGRHRVWLAIAWLGVAAGYVVLFGDRLAGMFRAWRMLQ